MNRNNLVKAIDGILSILCFSPYVISMCLYITTMFLSTILISLGAFLYEVKDKLYKIVINKQ